MSRNIEHFDVSLAGVTKPNVDGSDRQSLLQSCKAGDALLIEAEPDNLYDENAIRVCCRDGKQLGYIPADTARFMQQRARARDTAIKDRYKAFVNNIHGGTASKPTLGITISVVAPNPHGEKKTITDEESRD